MTLRFEIDQAEAFRQGINAPKSTVHLDVDPSTLPQEHRDLIADRLQGIDVCVLCAVGDEDGVTVSKAVDKEGDPIRVKAAKNTWAALLQAVKNDESKVKLEVDKLLQVKSRRPF